MVCYIMTEAEAYWSLVTFTYLDADRRNPFFLFEPCLWKAINRFGLVYFIIGNVLTGVVNLAFNTLESSDSACIVILFVYSFVMCTIVSLLYAREAY
ncbi:unnamed protein product [Soboliphyme baturini]|uniref:Ion_trans domain-containing protein n=1 Tax=Soboliphyme baturini TaxID=241478 RepID=A0A183IG30_9BILA|nr:unnamed protein product [Soboliphyme baturini]